MKYYIIALTIVLSSLSVSAQMSLDMSDLGKLTANFTAIEKVEEVTLQPIQATVTHKIGEAFQLVAPFEAQRHEFLVNNGELVETGQKLLLLSGSEVHHFMEQFEAAKALFNLADSRYKKNKKMFQQKSISNDKWQVIAKNYFDAKIEYGHYRHFNELVHLTKSEDEIIIKSPLAGYFFYPKSNSIDSGELKLGQVLQKKSLRLQAFIGADIAPLLHSLTTENCSIAIDEISQVSQGYYLKAWSKPLVDECKLGFGQTLRVTPHLKTNAFVVPKSSVFTIDRIAYVLIHKQQKLIAQAVSIIESNHENYYIQSDGIDGYQVLSSSVAAVQGMLMGLGGE